MAANIVQKKDMTWEILGTEYKVLNVPTYEMKSEEKEHFTMDITLKLSMIRDLMVANEIPSVVDFDEIASFKF